MVRAKKTLKLIWPYAGLPVLGFSLFLIHAERTAPFDVLLYMLIIIFGYIAAILDIMTRRIPNSIVASMLAAWVMIITPWLFTDTGAAVKLITDSALGFLLGGGLFLLVYLISRKGLGGGDVKFMATAGLYLGLEGAMAAMLVGTILAALTGSILILLKKIGRKDAIPLAPFLYAGMLVVCLR